MPASLHDLYVCNLHNRRANLLSSELRPALLPVTCPCCLWAQSHCLSGKGGGSLMFVECSGKHQPVNTSGACSQRRNAIRECKICYKWPCTSAPATIARSCEGCKCCERAMRLRWPPCGTYRCHARRLRVPSSMDAPLQLPGASGPRACDARAAPKNAEPARTRTRDR